MSVGCFTPYRQLGSCARRKPVWTYSVLVENKFGLFQSWVIESMFVCGVSLTSGQLINELFPDSLKVKLFALVLRHRGGDRIYEMRCVFVAVGPNARFIVLPHWNNMS